MKKLLEPNYFESNWNARKILDRFLNAYKSCMKNNEIKILNLSISINLIIKKSLKMFIMRQIWQELLWILLTKLFVTLWQTALKNTPEKRSFNLCSRFSINECKTYFQTEINIRLHLSYSTCMRQHTCAVWKFLLKLYQDSMNKQKYFQLRRNSKMFKFTVFTKK